MIKPIYASAEHQVIIEKYMNLLQEFVKDTANEQRFKNYLEVFEIIIEYHNGYGKGVKENNFYDWIMILPINLSVMTNGFFAGIETKRNAGIVRSYKVLLEELLFETVDKIETLEFKNE